MKRASRFTFTLIALAALSLAPAAHAQITFNFQFDDTFDTELNSTIVGTGVLNLTSDPGDGTFLYTTLAPTYTFTVNGNTFTQANIDSDPAQVRLVISTTAEGRRLQFTDDGDGSDGLAGGSLDLVNGTFNGAVIQLAFEPSYLGEGLNLYLDSVGGGTYRGFAASAVPEPGNVALLIGMGGTGAGFLVRRRRK